MYSNDVKENMHLDTADSKNTIMQSSAQKGGKNKAALMLAGAAAISLTFSPLIIPAFAAKVNGEEYGGLSDWSIQFTPAGVDSRLAELHKSRLLDKKQAAVKDKNLFPFTPAGLGNIGDRTLTVAARINDESTSNAVTLRNAVATTSNAGSGSFEQLISTKYNLKADKGWKGFKLSALPKSVTPAPVGNLERISSNIIDFRIDNKKKNAKPSKFQTAMEIGKSNKVVPNALGNAAADDYVLNVGGSFSITKRIDLTAGVRYEHQNDLPLPTNDQREDSEAVYVGTKIRF